MKANRQHAFAALSALALLGLPHAATATATLSTLGTSSVFIPFSGNVTNGQLTGSPYLPVSLNGGPSSNYVMDVGSQGIVVTPDVFNAAGLTYTGTNSQTYVSDGRIYSGKVYNVPVQVGTGSAALTTQVPVLVADTVSCTATGTNCPSQPVSLTTTPSQWSWSFIGIGFGQEGEQQPFGLPATNPLLNGAQAVGQSGTLTAGYIISSSGITVGLTPQNTAPFPSSSLATLTRGPLQTYDRDWLRAPVTVTVNGVSTTGTFLPDTGIRFAYLQTQSAANVTTIPGATNTVCPTVGITCVSNETITVELGNPGSPAATYTVTVAADGTPLPGVATPAFVRSIDPNPIAYWNSGYSFYNSFNYLFSSADGVVGYVPVSTAVPEPMSVALLGLGVIGLLAAGRSQSAGRGKAPHCPNTAWRD